MRSTRSAVVATLLFAGLVPAAGTPNPADAPAFTAAKALGRGVNLGNALDAPSEGEWGVTIKPGYLPRIKAAGFDHVRLPVRWSAHAKQDAPFTIDPVFFRRVDAILDQAEKVGLRVVLDVHHYDEMNKDPLAHSERLLALWRQIAARYKDRPETLVFEALNEPHDNLTSALWNDLFPKLLAVVRETNPTRMVIVGPGKWNNVGELKNLTLPADDRRLIATFHYYEPFQFTHQGAEWEKDASKWLGKKWTGTAAERKSVADAFGTAAKWGRENRRPIYLGEFGAYSKADMDSRATWTRFVRSEAERNGMPWAYWEFASGFGCYDPKTDEWREPLLKALVPVGE